MDWKQRMQPIQVGDRVAYSKRFLQSISCYAGDLPHAHGKVTALVTLGPEVTLAEIDWDTPDIPRRVNVRNLCEVSRLAFEL
jgi:hypothetical protein